MKGLRIDRERALRVAATCGLALLAATILPGLLRPPEPPQLPDDVGFRRSETAPAALMPPPAVSPRPGAAAEAERTGSPRNSDRPQAVPARRTGRDGKARRGARGKRQPDTRPAGTATAVPAPETITPPATPQTPAAVPVSPPSPPPVPPEPAAAPAGAMPGDGSEEFAPR